MAGTSATPTAESTNEQQQSEQTSPLGIKALCVLFGLVGVLLVAFGVLLLTGGGVLLGLFSLALGGLELALVYGLWTVKPWGWTLAIAVFSLTAIHNLLNMVGILNTAAGGTGSASIGFFMVLGILVYIYQKQDLYRNTGTRRKSDIS
jgi:hypothetical protein